MDKRQLVLASQSPRRRQLMTLAGYTFTTTRADIDETPHPNEKPANYTLRVSRDKAEAVRDSLVDHALIIASDTTVADGEEILGKPADADEAFAMLSQLRNRTHQVFTAVTLLDKATGVLVQDLAETGIKMRNYTDEEIRAYIATGDPFDKAGSYAIQHKGFHPVENLDGCYTNVVGLPLCNLLRSLRRFHIEPTSPLSENCQLNDQIQCAIQRDMLDL